LWAVTRARTARTMTNTVIAYAEVRVMLWQLVTELRA